MNKSYADHPVLKPNVFIMTKVSQHMTPIVAHTSGILRFCRCFLRAETSVVTTQRVAGDASAQGIQGIPVTLASISNCFGRRGFRLASRLPESALLGWTGRRPSQLPATEAKFRSLIFRLSFLRT